MPSSLLASADVIQLQTTEEYSNLDLTDVRSREENLKVVEPIRPNSFTYSENMKST
jgi:hypothetical protein